MITVKQSLGQLCENIALDYLKLHNLQPIKRNYLCEHGEIDLIMLEVDTLIFVEVRARKNYNFGHPIESIGARKQERLIKTANHFLNTNHINENNVSLRFDAVTMKTPRSNKNQNIDYTKLTHTIKILDIMWYKNIIFH